MALVDRSKVIGVSYQDVQGDNAVLLSAPGIKVKLLDGGELSGIIFKDRNNGEEHCLSGLSITGVIYEDEDSSSESILTADKVLGLIYQEGDSANHTILNKSRLVGVTYQDTGSTEVKLLGSPQLNARILNGSKITGVVHRETGAVTATSLRDAVLTGVLYREQGSAEEGIFTSLRILGIIYRDIEPAERARRPKEAEAPKTNGFRKTERILLYLLPVIGVLGLVLPLVFRQYNLTLLSSYLAVPLIVVPVAYLLYLRYYSSKTSPAFSL